MEKPLLSRQHLIYLLMAVLILLAGFGALIACPTAKAAEPDAAYYQRTGTKPSGADVWLGPGANYADQLDPALMLTVVPRSLPFIFTIDASTQRIDAQDGSAPYRVNGCTRYADWTTGGHTTGRVAFGFQFKLTTKR